MNHEGFKNLTSGFQSIVMMLARLFHQSRFQRHFGSGNHLRRSDGA